jgi:hypothetical protein
LPIPHRFSLTDSASPHTCLFQKTDAKKVDLATNQLSDFQSVRPKCYRCVLNCRNLNNLNLASLTAAAASTSAATLRLYTLRSLLTNLISHQQSKRFAANLLKCSRIRYPCRRRAIASIVLCSLLCEQRLQFLLKPHPQCSSPSGRDVAFAEVCP